MYQDFSPSRVSAKIFLPGVWPNPGEFPVSVHQGLPLSFASFQGLLSPSGVDLGHRASNGLKEPQLSSQGSWQDLQTTVCHFSLIFLCHITDLGLCFSGAGKQSITGDSVLKADLGRK